MNTKEWFAANKPRRAKWRAAYRERNRERLRESSRKYAAKQRAARKAAGLPTTSRTYDITVNRRRRKLPEPTRPCPQLCESCGNLPNGRGALHLDHDHDTGEFRGWLCMRCNIAIGGLGDNYEGVLRALDYLLRNG